MEEDIKVLEEYVQEFNENKKKYKLAYSTGFGKFWSDFVKAIENLINRNKQLEEIEKEHKKENGELRERVEELEKCENYYKNVRKKIEEYNKMINATYGDITYHGDIRRDNCIEIRNVLQELLEEGDK